MRPGPIFCLTADVDWASEYAIANFLEICATRGVRPTVFATHQSDVLTDAVERETVEIGVHPNFASGSTHGETVEKAIEHVFQLYPMAATYRCHRMADGARIQTLMRERGISYDSNIGLYFQPGLVPLRLATGLIRYPIFWADDSHFRLDPDNWKFDALLPRFLTDGLKVIDVHPLNLAVNASTVSDYEAARPFTANLDEADAARLRNQGLGAETFVTELLDYLLASGHRFFTLRELFEQSDETDQGTSGTDVGRTTPHTSEEFDAYWSMSDQERQAFMRDSFKRRNARDPYATSRDTNLRDLEIEAIISVLAPGAGGPTVDLGCGNGLTLIRIAERFPTLGLIGVDFSPELIEGAEYLASSTLHKPTFHCADAFDYLATLSDASVAQLITERFVMNLPSQEAQWRLLREARRVLAPGGRLILCEASTVGFSALNDVRARLGLERVAERSADNVSVIRFDDAEFEQRVEDTLQLTLRQKLGFSDFFLLSRVGHPALVAPRSPRFDAPINAVARDLQRALPFRSGYGANTVWVFHKPHKPE